MREVWRWGINPEEPAYKRTILLSLLGQEVPICAVGRMWEGGREGGRDEREGGKGGRKGREEREGGR